MNSLLNLLPLRLVWSRFEERPGAVRSLAQTGPRETAKEEDSTKEEDGLGPAFERFAQGDWAAAFDELKRLADAGMPQAVRIALLMNAHGPRLFGGCFVVAQAQRQRWNEAASATAGDAPPRVASATDRTPRDST